MEQQNQQQDLSFTLNGKDYKYSECTEEQQQIVQQLNDLQNQIRIRFQIYASFMQSIILQIYLQKVLKNLHPINQKKIIKSLIRK